MQPAIQKITPPLDAVPSSGVRLSNRRHEPWDESAALDERIMALDAHGDPKLFVHELEGIAADLFERLDAARTDDGALASMLADVPRLWPRAQRLWQRHLTIESAIRSLRRYAAAAAPPVFIAHYLTCFRNEWAAYGAAELALFQDAMLTDLGEAG